MASKSRFSGARCRSAALRAQSRRYAALRAWLVVLVLAAAVALLSWFEPLLSRLLIQLEQPPFRPDIHHAIVLDNSASNDMLRPRTQPAQEALAISETLGSLCGHVATTVWRFSSQPVELYSGSNDFKTLNSLIRSHYLKVNPDPTPGTLLAKALRQIFNQTPPDKLLIISIGTDLWEDAEAVRDLLHSEQSRRDFLLIIHGVPIHNPRTAPTQRDLRGDIRRSLDEFKLRVLILSQHDFPTHKAWLADQLARRKRLQVGF